MTDNGLRRMHIRSAQAKIERAWLTLKEEADCNGDELMPQRLRLTIVHLALTWRKLDADYNMTLGMDEEEAMREARHLTDEGTVT